METDYVGLRQGIHFGFCELFEFSEKIIQEGAICFVLPSFTFSSSRCCTLVRR